MCLRVWDFVSVRSDDWCINWRVCFGFFSVVLDTGLVKKAEIEKERVWFYSFFFFFVSLPFFKYSQNKNSNKTWNQFLKFSPTHSTANWAELLFSLKTKQKPHLYIIIIYIHTPCVFYFVCVSISRFFALSLSKYYRILKCHFSRFVTQLTFILPLPPPSFLQIINNFLNAQCLCIMYVVII